jgi:hypothetical protein
MTKTPLAVAILAGFVLVPRVTEASSITWQFAGTMNNGAIAEIPVGTYVSISWTFDSAQANTCAPGQPTGVYLNQNLDVTIFSTIGPLHYTATGGRFYVNTYGVVGCNATGNGGMELRFLGAFTGPDLPEAVFSPDMVPAASGLFWGDNSSIGDIPTTPPDSANFNWGVYRFISGSHTQPTVLLGSSVAPIPEPSTVVLLASGLALLWHQARRRSDLA